MLTKEMIEKEIYQNKKNIIKTRKMEILKRFANFKRVDKKLFKKFKGSIYYSIYIMIFVSLILMQLSTEDVNSII